MGRRTRESKRLQNWYVIFYNFFSSSFIEALIIYLCVYVCSFLSLFGFHNYYVFHKGVIFICVVPQFRNSFQRKREIHDTAV